jgi:chromosome segregation ATPase
MLKTIVDLVKSSRTLQFALVFLGGITVGVLFYPTKIIKDSLQKTYQSQITTLTQQQSQTLSQMKSTYDSQVQTLTQTNSDLTSKVTALTTQVTDLKSHQTNNYVKVIHPDGTIEIKDTSEKDSSSEQEISQQIQQEYEQKLQTQITQLQQTQATTVSTMQKTWDSKEQSYQSQIATLTQTHSETINPKNFGIEAGVLTNRDYYGHVTYDIFGPFFIGAHAEFGTATNAGGLGLGLKF